METAFEDLHKACRLGDVSLLKSILTAYPSFLNQVDSKLKWSPLYRTVICGHIEATEYLLSIGSDANIKNNLGETPLHQAADNSQKKLIKLLLSHKADPNLQQNDGSTPLHQSAFKGEEVIVEILLKHGANPNIPNNVFGKTPLHYAVEYQHEKTIKILMAFGANALLKDKTERSALDIATGPIKSLLIKSPGSSIQNSPLFLPSPEPVDNIPAIPLESFTELNLSPKSLLRAKEEYISKPSYSISTILEPDGEKSQVDEMRASKAFSFGGCDGKSLKIWLESVKLECLFETLMNAGYDDYEQMANQMLSGVPITDETLASIGITKPGHCRRLLAALDEENRPFRSSRRTYRSNQSNPIKCCIAVPCAPGAVNLIDLQKWLELMELQEYYESFIEAGYEDLEHLLALMNSRYEITEKALIEELGMNKQAHRYKILARLKAECSGFDTMKRSGGNTSRQNRDIAIEKAANSTACGSCELF